ncbi:MAG TPA: serine/threonine-protein kinase, partial [Polyangiaceae bacterium]
MTSDTSSDLPFGPGDILAGKYRIERVLGQGGMGVVVAAHHLQLDEMVALKFLLPEVLQSPEAVVRFVREARAAARIKSEHVARVSDVGQLESGLPYMVMEYLEGSDLSQWLAQRGAVPVEQAVDWVLQACEAIAEAHALGIVHRDLKPSNLFCIRRADGQLSIKLLDFGTSKITTPGAPGFDMTRTHALVGSPLYMSPEQMLSSKNVDARTDIWSLGTILFELLTDRAPFAAESLTELAVRVSTEPAPALRTVCPQAPPGLALAIAKCLEKDPAQRFQNVGELAASLADFGSVKARASVNRVLDTLREAGAPRDAVPTSSARLLAAVPSAPVVLALNTASAWGATEADTRRATTPARRAQLLPWAVALLAIAAVGGALLVTVGMRPSPGAASPAGSPA